MNYKKDIVNYKLSETLISMIKSPAFLVKLNNLKRPIEFIACNKEALIYLDIPAHKVEGMKIEEVKTKDQNKIPWIDILANQNGDVLCYSIENDDGGEIRYFQVTNRPSFLDKKKYAFISINEITVSVKKDAALLTQHQMQQVIGNLLSLTHLEMDLDELLDKILMGIISVDWHTIDNKGSIFIYNEEKDILEMRASKNLLGCCVEAPVGNRICDKVGGSKKCYYDRCIDVSNNTSEVKEYGHYGIPILSSNDEIQGVLNVYLKSNSKLNDEEVAFFESVARVIAIVLRYKVEHDHNEELKKQMFMSSKMASLGELAAGVAHEINNPLMVIKGNLERLKDDLENSMDEGLEQQKINIEAQEKSIESIIEIASGLKGYARMKDVSDGPIDLHQVIKETISLIRFIYKKDGITFDLKLSAKNVNVFSSYVKMQQVLMNLFSNARDALSTSERKNIIISTKNIDDRLVLKVADSGHGITKENRQKVFDKYFTTKELGKGTGLGMGIVKTILDSMDAKANLTSKLGMGTIFSFVFPIIKDIHPQQNLQKEVKEMKLSGKVLVVDDSPELLEIFSFYLIKLGLEVAKTDSPKEALQLLEKNKYDFMMSDLKMDEMGGAELSHKVRACGFDKLKIILVSGDIDALNRLSDMQEKYHDAFIPKPFNKESLYDVLVSLKNM